MYICIYIYIYVQHGGLCEIKGEGDSLHIALDRYQALHPEVELRTNLRSIFHRCHHLYGSWLKKASICPWRERLPPHRPQSVPGWAN